ncbi:YqgE/AlgH family protein [Flaviaesturariibacter aridisoli]|uniref:YqgE/AlgH family protein n=1 Tax=Flaviaesturariibacter aridisoli TaxID=2545761 RepID=A0A4R4DZ93_9BACT|nr:YqgE/AlgH family protein [Flaviaesturariibacter aridisoli]TCZ69573.1 YqgE/AlgH family protein [Flaviaesturariibacter aridisoli]
MELRAGIFLHSTPLLDDTVFADVVLFLKEYNASGALGVIVNRPHGRSLHELVEFRHSRPLPLFYGGPVAEQHLYFLHRRPDLIGGGEPVVDGVYWGGDFPSAVRAYNNKTLDLSGIKVFVGYCGWDAGELEAEVEEGSWLLSGLPVEVVFEP